MLLSEKKNAFLGNLPFEIPVVAYPFLRLMVPVAKKTGLLGWPKDTALSLLLQDQGSTLRHSLSWKISVL